MQDSKADTKKYKIWGIATAVCFVLMVILLALPTIVIDPYFHYHGPLKSLEYPLNNEWYQNDGMVRNFEYDALITGTSMTENFKTSEFDKIFGVHSIKTPYSGGRFSQINTLVKQGVRSNPNLSVVLRGLDYNRIIEDDFTTTRSDVPFPEYLYNQNPFDDVKYVLNKDVLLNNTFNVLTYTKEGKETPSFDKYVNWNANYKFGKKTLNKVYERPEAASEEKTVTEEDYKRVAKNMEVNVIEVARNNPQITFYYFITPYSIYYFDQVQRLGELKKSFALQEAAIKQMLACDNIKLFSFFTNYDMICDPDNYKDIFHYGEWVNTDILHWIKEGKYQLTMDNYEDYMEDIRSFYFNYDYDALFKKASKKK